MLYFLGFLCISGVYNFYVYSYIDYSNPYFTLYRFLGIFLVGITSYKFFGINRKLGHYLHKIDSDGNLLQSFFVGFFIGYFALIVKITDWYNYIQLNKNHIQSNAIILYCEHDDYCVYEYEVSGRLYQAKFYSKEYNKGDEIQIIYHPLNPVNCRVDE